MKSSKTTYQSYLLRLWCEAKEAEWRASLENVATGECRHFPSMSSLFAFLKDQTLSRDISNNRWSPQNTTETSLPAFNQYSEEEV